MALDKNEKRLVEKLVEALTLIHADKQDIGIISETKRSMRIFLPKQIKFLMKLKHAMYVAMPSTVGEIR